MLICGKRGVGKTSVVFSAIHEAKRLEAKKTLQEKERLEKEYRFDEASSLEEKAVKILPILVNAPGFEISKDQKENDEITDSNIDKNNKSQSESAEQESPEFRRAVLQNVVRRLYQVTRTIDKNGKVLTKEADTSDKTQLDNKKTLSDSVGISELFTKAVATEVRKIINLEELEKNSRLVEKELKTNLISIEKLLGIGASFVAAIVIALNPVVQGLANSVISLLTATVPSLIAISWQYKQTTSSENKGEKKDTQYYRHDYDTNTLQSDLEDKLRSLSRQNFKVVFVIDELDKIKESEITKTIKSLKTFFNQSFTLFILISGEEFFKKMLNEIQLRPKEYTLFPQKIFVQRPLFDEMEKFLDKITNNQGETKFGKAYTRFQNYACYACKTDFFDLYNVVRDHMSYDENGNSFLDVNLVDRKHIIQAELQKAMGQIYSRKRYEHISDWYKNDLLLDEMYELLYKLTKYKSGTKITIAKTAHLEITFPDETDNKVVNDAVQAGALEDLVYYLEKLRFLKKEGGNYEIKGKIDEVPKNPIINTQEEKDFLEEYRKLRDLLFAYADIYSRFNNYVEVFYDTSQIINKFDEIGISSSSPSSPSHIKNVSELISTYHNIEDRKLEDKKVPIIVEREKLERNTQLAIEARNEYIDHFILLVQRILELTNPKRHVKVVPWSHIYEEKKLPVPVFLENSPTNLILALEDNSVIAQNLPLDLIYQVKNSMNYMLLLTTTTEGDFTSPVTKSLSKRVTSFLKSDSGIPSGILELKIPTNSKLLYRLLYGIMPPDLKFSDTPPVFRYEPIEEEQIITSNEPFNVNAVEFEPSSKAPPPPPPPDTTLPTVVAVTPKDKDPNVPINPFITARFSEPMRSSTITIDTFTLRDSDNNPITATVAVTPDALTAIFTPSAKLSERTQYTATITRGVTDQTGNPMVSDKIWSFTTRRIAPKMPKNQNQQY